MTSITVDPLYVVDTHALLWYLKGDKKLSATALSLFRSAEQGNTLLVIPAIVVAELYWLNKKWQFLPDFKSVYRTLRQQAYIRFVDFNSDHVLDFEIDAAIPEMHDRIIVGVARRLQAALITADSQITDAQVVVTIW